MPINDVLILSQGVTWLVPGRRPKLTGFLTFKGSKDRIQRLLLLGYLQFLEVFYWLLFLILSSNWFI